MHWLNPQPDVASSSVSRKQQQHHLGAGLTLQQLVSSGLPAAAGIAGANGEGDAGTARNASRLRESAGKKAGGREQAPACKVSSMCVQQLQLWRSAVRSSHSNSSKMTDGRTC